MAAVRAELASLKQQMHAMHTAQLSLSVTMNAVAAKLQCDSYEYSNDANREQQQQQQHRQQRARVAHQHRCALDKDKVLDEVFSYVGIGEYIYAAAVCRRWRGRYIKLCYNKAAEGSTDKLRTCYKSTITTADRFQLALDSGLTVAALQESSLWSRVGGYIVRSSLEPVAVFTLAKLHDLKWLSSFCNLCVITNNLALLQWLRRSGCTWDANLLRENASAAANTAMLKWLYAVTKPWSQEVRDELLWDAGVNGHLELAKWSREVGAAWPSSFYNIPVAFCEGLWDLPLMQWALANGCPWGAWQCKDMLPQHWTCWTCEDQQAPCYRNSCDSNLACDVLRWAHDNGCPCTCDAETAAAVQTAIAQQQQQQQLTLNN
jgi:hypothetical protein